MGPQGINYLLEQIIIASVYRLPNQNIKQCVQDSKMCTRIGTFVLNLNYSIHSTLFSQQISEECLHVLGTIVTKKDLKIALVFKELSV